MIKILTKDGNEVVAGQDYYKIDTWNNKLQKVKINHNFMVIESEIALHVNEDVKETTLHFYYSDLSKAYEAIYNHIHTQYEKDIKSINDSYSQLESE